MNVWAVSYRFNNQNRTLLIESDETSEDQVLNNLHPSLQTKNLLIEFVGTLA